MMASSDEDFDASKWLQKIARWLMRKDYTEIELRQRLQAAQLHEDQQNQLLERVQTLGWLADERVAQSAVDRKASQWGKKRLQYYLQQRGIAPTLIEEVTSDIDEESEQQRAYALWMRKFRQRTPSTPQEYQKHMRFLLQRGFSGGVIRKVLAHASSGEVQIGDVEED